MKNLNEVTITDIDVNSSEIIISFHSSEQIEAWLENKNKHEPDILYLNVDKTHQNIVIEEQTLRNFMERSSRHTFRLSLCTVSSRIRYQIKNRIPDNCFNGILICAEEDMIFFCEGRTVPESFPYQEQFLEIQHKNHTALEGIAQLPVEILNIGSCFSRSIFKSDTYFNPAYKKYFHVKKTLFHNSFISLFSDRIDYDYTQVEDLMTGDAALYAGIEFRKDIEHILKEGKFQLVVADIL